MRKLHPIALIMLAVLAWGVFHAIGAYTFNWNIYRPMMVIGCSLAFLGFWLVMLQNRKRRLERRKAVQEQP
jgi:protein-S-isoprenylcysteine O-methyltransferase Ste14